MPDDGSARPSRPETVHHQILLVGRRVLTIDGVKQVDSFDDDTILLNTHLGTLTIRGKNLRIQQLDVESGRFAAEGDVDALQYAPRRDMRNAQGLFQKLWR
jgi:sporulation protein YabP